METLDLFKLIDNYKSLADRIAALKEELNDLNVHFLQEKDELAQHMSNNEIQNITRNGFTYSLVAKTKYSKTGDEELFFETLKKNGLGELIKQTVNAQSLNSAMNEIAEENDGVLPEEFNDVINVYSFLDISKRKKAK